jgi:dipeptidyl-peptidase-4
MDLVRYDFRTGKSHVIVPADKLIPAGSFIPLQVSDYYFSEDEKQLLIFTNTKRVWRRHTRGDYWLLNLDDWNLEKLGGDASPSTMMFATFSPDGKKIGYVIDNNLYVENVKDHQITPLTTDGSETLINATSDWVYEEELGLRNGFRWSPDSKKIAYWQLDSEGVGIFYLINNIDSRYPKLIPIRYPKVGTTNSACRIGVVSADGGKTVWMKIPGDPRNHYIAWMDWAANSDEVMMQQLNRLQNMNKVMVCNVATGTANTVFIDTDECWVEENPQLRWVDKGKKFSWISERDGWQHFYLISRDGKDITLITPGEYDVISVEAIDEQSGYLYYIASPDNPTERYLYRTRLDGKGKAQKLSPADQRGTHAYQISPNSKRALHTFSTMDDPPVVSMVKLADHQLIRVVEDNAELRARVNKLKRTPTEFIRVDIGNGVQLDGYRIKPYNFDPNKRYPVLFYVYGEPAGQTARNSWGGSTYLWHTMLAQQGYIILNFDNRGTKAPRGRAWRKSIYKRIGILASADQAEVCRLVRKWDYVDSTRIGIWGWSGGGQMSLNAIFRYPELYSTAMAIAFISDERNYDTIYQERYMALPETNPDGYINGSPITFAHQLKGNLLIMNGTGDDNCHYQNAEMLENELIKYNKMFTAVPYPMRTHSISERENTTRHVRTTLTWYLNNNMPPGPANE